MRNGAGCSGVGSPKTAGKLLSLNTNMLSVYGIKNNSNTKAKDKTT